MLRRKISIGFVIFTFILNLIPFYAVSAKNDYFEPATITDYQKDNNFAIIKGETLEGTEVLVYDNLRFVALIDGERKLENGKMEFVYKSETPLTEGKHTYKVLARNKTSMLLSIFSNEAVFNIVPKSSNLNVSIPAPTLLQPNENTITAKVMPLITGLTINNTRVNIYIDGVLNGGTANLSHESGTANFAYKPFLNLSVGNHVAWAIAVDDKGGVSKASNVLSFRIEDQLPAPVLKEVFVDEKIVRISGNVKNDLKVRIFVDHKIVKEIMPNKDDSGVANFVYTSNKNLSKGNHVFYLTALDGRGKESKWSNIVYKNFNQPSGMATSTKTDNEEVEVLSIENYDFQKVKELLVLARLLDENKKPLITEGDLVSAKEVLERKKELKLSNQEVAALEKLLNTKKEDKQNETNSEIEEIIKPDINKNGEETGIINESKENQGGLKLNLIIFILFLIAVVGWIFWVNRELIKERREQNEESEKNK